MDDNSQFVSFKIDAVIPNSKSVHYFSSSLEFAKAFKFCGHDFLRQSAEFTENIELEILRHSRQLGRAGWIEDYLKWAHRSFSLCSIRYLALVARTGIEPVFRP